MFLDLPPQIQAEIRRNCADTEAQMSLRFAINNQIRWAENLVWAFENRQTELVVQARQALERARQRVAACTTEVQRERESRQSERQAA